MIEAGVTLAHYRLVEKIGEGGMGVVWKAQDTTLNREVAIKILPDAFAADPDRRSRFEREARLLATLNHPGIAGVYGLHEAEGVTFIAMELVPGEDLSERLERGPLAVDDAIDVARQVAEALETAHEQGIVHRDLKPANIKQTPDGRIKVLDLGLAKALETEMSGKPGSLSFSPTVTSAGTVAGTLLGTAAYMSPEQVKGHPADRRADIWAFGVVLREMLTGASVFAGETISETLASVLRDEVDETTLPKEVPAGVRRLIRRCLVRDRRTRLQDIGEARIALSPEGLAEAEGLPTGAVAAAPPAGRSRLPWAIAATALAGLAVVSWFAAIGRGGEPPPEVRATIAPPDGMRFTISGTSAGAFSISPDGTRMTFVASTGVSSPSLYLRTLGSTDPRVIPGTEGASLPFWSPDSRQLAFFVGGALKKLDLAGGAPMTVARAPDARGGTWGPDGTILFAPDTQSPIGRVSEGGVLGDPVTVLDPDRDGESTHRHPSFLPDGRHFLYVRGSHAAADTDPVQSIWIGDTESDDTFELMPSITQARYAQGHVFWVREGFLMARPFDPDALAFTGDAFAVGEGVVVQPDSWTGSFAVSEAGPIVFQTGLAPERQLTWFDRAGKVLGTIGESDRFDFIRLSPDDRTLAATLLDSTTGRGDIWVYDLRRNVGSRLTFDDANDVGPVWSPDGDRIAFSSTRDGKNGIYVRSAGGRGSAELLYESERRIDVEDWSRDGKYITFGSGAGKSDLWIYSVEERTAAALVVGDFDEGYARFSPDSAWIAYASNEAGNYQMYLTRFPDAEGKWQLTQQGADWILGWSQAGDEIYYMDLEGKICAVTVELTDQVVADLPTCLFDGRAGKSWDSSLDGQRFVVGVPDDAGSDYPVTLVLNWSGRR